MKNTLTPIGLLTLLFLFVACNNTQEISDEEMIQNLNGYWKIDKVERPQFNDVKEYDFNNTAEYIELYPDLEGFRIKLQPQLDSTFKKSSKAETFTIKRENDSIKMHYKTPMDEWTETLISLEKDKFSVQNKKGFTYTYKRFESLAKELGGHE